MTKAIRHMWIFLLILGLVMTGCGKEEPTAPSASVEEVPTVEKKEAKTKEKKKDKENKEEPLEKDKAKKDKKEDKKEEKKREEKEFLDGTVGIVFPSEEAVAERDEAQLMQEQLEEKGYEVKLVYAGGDGKKQGQLIKELVKEKVSCMIVRPINSNSLKKPLKKAVNQGIKVIAYDQLISDTRNVSYYVGFDYLSVGESMGSYLVETKKLDTAKREKRTETIEFFMGDLNDSNGKLQMEGIMNVLTPYMEEGVLVSKSLRTTYEDVSIALGSEEIAVQTCDAIMKANYMDKPVDIVCAGSDALADSIVKALKEQSGFEKDWPILMGMGGSKSAFQRMEEGLQDVTVYSDRSNLPKLCTDLADRVLQEDKPRNLDKVNNGKKEVPSVFGRTKIAYRDNYEEVMQDAGITLE